MIDLELVKTNIPGLHKDKKTNTVINNSANDYKRVVEYRKKAKEILMIKQDIEGLKVGFKELYQKIADLEHK